MLLGKSFYKNKEVKRDVSGINVHEINYRSLLARREMRKSHTTLSTFSGLMNLLPPPMQIESFKEIQDNFSEVYKQKAAISMHNNAVNEFSVSEAEGEEDKINQYYNDKFSDNTVPGDRGKKRFTPLSKVL